jgi:cellulose biosynthesis protein BcsQ
MIRRPKGEFDELIVEAEHGVDIVPEHNQLADLGDWLRREQEQASAVGDAFNIHAALLSVLSDAGVRDEYDVLICDPPATEGPHLHNAINATRSLVIPVEPSAKGQAAVEGLEQLVAGLEETLDVDVGVLAAVPVGVKGTNDQSKILDEVQYSMPETFGDRTSLMEGCWAQQCSAFTYVLEHRDRRRDYEMETLARYDRLARYLEETAGIEAPNPPEPGALEEVA